MGRVVQFPGNPSSKYGLQKVGKKTTGSAKKSDPGQLNIFEETSEAKVIQMPQGGSFFDHALNLDDKGLNEAKEAYERAIQQGDNIADALCNLGVIEFSLGNAREAVNCFTRALKEDSRHLEAHFNLANLYSEKGNYDLAQLHYEVAITIDENFEHSYYNLGLVFISKKSYREALEILSVYRKMVNGEDNEANALIENLKRTLE